MEMLATARTREACGVLLLQRARLISCGGSCSLLTARIAKHNEAAFEMPSRKLRRLLVRHCCGGALARWLLQQRALKTLLEASWQHAQGEEVVGRAERCYGD
jgi:hypothetical protein